MYHHQSIFRTLSEGAATFESKNLSNFQLLSIMPSRREAGQSVRFSEFRFLVKSDLYRYTAKISIAIFLKNAIASPGFKYSFLMRTCSFLRQHKILRFNFYYFVKLILNHYTYKYGISIPYDTKIGSGFYIGHFGGIVVHERVVIGRNCNISHGVTLGQANRGERKGFPVIGSNVYIGPGAKIFGKVKVGDNVAIGANCVVTRDVPDKAVVVGIPARVISYSGSEGYINRTGYEPGSNTH